MATTFNNGESLASIRAKLNANAGEINGKANLSGGNPFSGLNIFSNNDTFFGDQTKNWVNIGNLGTGDNTYIDTQGVNANVPLIIRTKGSGAVSIEADTYIDSSTFSVNGQNWTSAWTSYTPSALMTSGSGASFTVYGAKIKQIGKTVFIHLDIGVAGKGTASGDFGIINPFSAVSTFMSGGIYRGATQIGLLPQANGTTIKVVKTAGSGVLQWSDISNGDLIYMSGCIEIA